MKKIIPFLIVGLFFLSGLNGMATDENLDNGFTLELYDSKIYIAQIIIPYSRLSDFK